MASFDHTILHRILGAVPGGGAGLFSGRRVAGSSTQVRQEEARRSRECLTTPQEEGWLWSERVAPFGISDVRVTHHLLGALTGGAATACPARGWGMVIAGCATLNMRRHTNAAIHSETLAEGDVWSIPASAVAWFHCHETEQASVVAFIGGREPEDIAGQWPEICPDSALPPPGFHHRLLQQKAQRTCWGRLRVVEADAFSDPDALSAALVEVDSGRRTDLHWHLNTSVWQICLEGSGQLTRMVKGVGQRSSALRPGMMAYIPRGEGYLIHNDGDGPLRLLEIFRSDHYHDLSLSQWLAASSTEDIAAQLHVDVGVVANLVNQDSKSFEQVSPVPSGHGPH